MKTLVGLSDDNKILSVDTIEHEGKIWLVPKWLASPVEGVQRPERLVRIDVLQHQRIVRKPGSLPADYVLNSPVPRHALEGAPHRQKEPAFEIVWSPDIQVPLDHLRKH